MDGRVEVVLFGALVVMFLVPYAAKHKIRQYPRMSLAMAVLGVVIAGVSFYDSRNTSRKLEELLQQVVNLLNVEKERPSTQNTESALSPQVVQQPVSSNATNQSNPRLVAPKRRKDGESQKRENHESRLACCLDQNPATPCGNPDQPIRAEADSQAHLNSNVSEEQPVFRSFVNETEQPIGPTPVLKRNSHNYSGDLMIYDYVRRVSRPR